MNTFTIISIAFGLAMDCFAVSLASGLTAKDIKLRHSLKIATSFGGFQAVMPVIGWSAGLGLRNLITGIDHWIAFGLLNIIGIKMLIESREMRHEKKVNPLNTYALILLSIATSIDALAVGLSLSFLNVPIVSPVIIIGAITFLISFIGIYTGRIFGGRFKSSMVEIAGGLILIGIGIKILVEHLST